MYIQFRTYTLFQKFLSGYRLIQNLQVSTVRILFTLSYMYVLLAQLFSNNNHEMLNIHKRFLI